MRRTMPLPLSKEDAYRKMFLWFSLQGHEIESYVENEKLNINLMPVNLPVYWAVGVLLVWSGVIPGVLWFTLMWRKIHIALEDSPNKDGLYIVADIRGAGVSKTYNYMIGVLSLMPPKDRA
jgi:hypothetical protein